MGMSQVQQEAIYRTSSERTVKMMVIMLGICIAGGAIFFGMWDYWISQLPAVVAQEIADSPPPAIPSGEDIPVSLNFVESDDLLTLGFNAITGEPDANPIISAKVGDRIIFDVTNAGRSFHSFGVTSTRRALAEFSPARTWHRPWHRCCQARAAYRSLCLPRRASTTTSAPLQATGSREWWE